MTITENRLPTNWQWRNEPKAGGRCVVFDIDGVLANASSRQHLITQGNNDWKTFFESCGNDEVITESSRVLELLAPDVARVLLTGRPVGVRDKTIDWLNRKELPWDLLIMRDRGQYADSITFKQQAIRSLRLLNFQVELVLEDDPQNRDMFIDEGVPCMYVHSGYYEERNDRE